MLRRLAAVALLATAALAALAQQPDPRSAALPSLEELEAAGAVIGQIRIVAEDVFDLANPAENNALFRLANQLHIQTRAGVIRGQLLFKTGDKLVAQRIKETERNLRANRYLYAAHIRPVALDNGVVDLEVSTRDTWSLEFGARLRQAGGTTSSGADLREVNLAGTGLVLGVSSRSSSEVTSFGGSGSTVNWELAYPYALDGHTGIRYLESTFDDGASRSLAVSRPFYALDTRGAGDFAVSGDNRLYTRYADGVSVGQFRKQAKGANFSGGWSAGLVDGWTQRYSLGLTFSNERYGLVPWDPAPLPEDRTLYTPFVRYEVIEDNFREVTNVESIGRPEYQALGLQAGLQVGRSLTGLGSTLSVTQYAASISKGFRFSGARTLLAATGLSGEYANGESDRVLWNASARYYQRRGSGNLLYLALSADATDFSDDTRYLSLGGDTGLRGYPSDYQRGDRRVLFTVEQRLYTDWYPFRLIRVGGAVFYDVGRAWGGPFQRTPQAHWNDDVGFGLRLLNARSARGTTLHIDFAFPIGREPGIDSYQLTIESKTGF